MCIYAQVCMYIPMNARVCGSMGVWMYVRKCGCMLAPRTNPTVAAAVACVLEHPGCRNDRPQQTAGRTVISLIQSKEITSLAP